MDIWEKKLKIKKPDSCNRKAICCQSATCVKPWEKICKAPNNQEIKDFFNIFTPYKSNNILKEKFPDAYISCINVLKERKDIKQEELYFYYCRFLEQPNSCLIYEDRPTLCREFPDSPLGAIPASCGFKNWSKECINKLNSLTLELNNLKLKQYSNFSFYIISPVSSWVR